jgi:hypothetical protein
MYYAFLHFGLRYLKEVCLCECGTELSWYCSAGVKLYLKNVNYLQKKNEMAMMEKWVATARGGRDIM